MKTTIRVSALTLLLLAAAGAQAQKRTLDKKDFATAGTAPLPFRPFEKTDFAPAGTPDDALVTLPGKQKIKLSEYVRTLNKLEGNLAAIGIPKTRAEKTVLASRYRLAGAMAVTGLLPQAITLQKSAAKPKPLLLSKRFLNRDLQFGRNLVEKAGAIAAANAERINALPNEKFERNQSLTPPAFEQGDYGVKLVGNYYLKGENDPFVIGGADMNDAALTRLMKGTTAFYTAGLKLTVSATLPEVGTLAAYEVDAEFTARANATQKHSARAKIAVLQQVLLNETPNISGDNFTYTQNRSFQLNKLVGAANIFQYGLNTLLPVDFYLDAVGVGADIDVDLKRTDISGSMGPRASQSIILETSATELLFAGAEVAGGIVDAGVGGELRLVEGGIDYGFSAGMALQNRRLVFLNDIYAGADIDFLKGRLYTFYQYPYFKCGNILLEGLDLACWETRRVENDLFSTPTALRFEKKLLDEDKSAYVSW